VDGAGRERERVVCMDSILDKEKVRSSREGERGSSD